MEKLNKESFKLLGIYAAIIIGIFMLYREAHFWMTYQTVQKDFVSITNAMTDFQSDFIKRADEFKRRKQDFDRLFNEREEKMNERFEKFERVENPRESSQSEKISQIESQLQQQVAAIFNDIERPLAGEDPNERLIQLQKEVADLRKGLSDKRQLEGIAKVNSDPSQSYIDQTQETKTEGN